MRPSIIVQNSSDRPGNAKRAKPYAASAANSVVATVVPQATSTELAKYWAKWLADHACT
jgi:hypothetical protein